MQSCQGAFNDRLDAQKWDFADAAVSFKSMQSGQSHSDAQWAIQWAAAPKMSPKSKS